MHVDTSADVTTEEIRFKICEIRWTSIYVASTQLMFLKL